MIKINWNESSTKRGAVWIITAIVGSIMLWQGKDIEQLLLLAAGVAGGLGFTQEDTPVRIENDDSKI